MRSVFSRLLLLGLVVTLGVLVFRAASGGGGIVAIEDVGTDALEHQAFEVREASRLAIDASGSVETTASDTTVLAALPWIVRRSDGAVVWRLPARRPQRGTYVTLRDTLALEPGVYDAYLSTFGDPDVRVVEAGESLGGRIRSVLSGAGRAWHGDAGRWKLLVAVVQGDAERLRGTEARPDRDDDAGALWTANAVRSRQTRETMLRVGTPSELAVRAVGEILDGAPRDSAYVVRIPEQDTVWVFRDGEWAGGAQINRRAETTLTLDPGLYRVAYVADRSHAWDDWRATPPWAPWTWGLRLRAAPEADIALFDGADLSAYPTVAAFTCVGPDADLEDVFTLPEAGTFIIRGVGEISNRDAYDWGELLRANGDTVWRMTRETTEPAGGESRNRQTLDILALDAGTYRLRYVSDESHHCDDYSSDGPDDESLWGVALYAADPGYDVEAVTHTAPAPATTSDSAEDGAAGAGASGEILARLDRLGNDLDVSGRFRLDGRDSVRVVALGELLRSDRLDYGWIEDADGEIVWEMTRETSAPAGGADKNRRSDATLALDAGSYTVRFRTNGRHAFGAFDGAPPDQAEDWGIRVERIAPVGATPAPGASPGPDAEPPPPPPAPPDS